MSGHTHRLSRDFPALRRQVFERIVRFCFLFSSLSRNVYCGLLYALVPGTSHLAFGSTCSSLCIRATDAIVCLFLWTGFLGYPSGFRKEDFAFCEEISNVYFCTPLLYARRKRLFVFREQGFSRIAHALGLKISPVARMFLRASHVCFVERLQCHLVALLPKQWVLGTFRSLRSLFLLKTTHLFSQIVLVFPAVHRKRPRLRALGRCGVEPW